MSGSRHSLSKKYPQQAKQGRKSALRKCKKVQYRLAKGLLSSHLASFFRFMAANLSLTHCVTRVRPRRRV